MKVFRFLGKIYDRVNNFFVFLAALCVVFMMVSITIDVAGRYFFNSPLIWGVEINENMILYMTFLAAAWVLKSDGHVSVELFTSRLRERPRNIVLLVNSIIGIIICLIVTWYGIELTYKDAVFGMFKPTVLRIPNVYILWVIPLGTLMLAIGFIRKSYVIYQKLRGIIPANEATASIINVEGAN
jgi:TRAP-type C4-dicarboxylate transport system permease small subunit